MKLNFIVASAIFSIGSSSFATPANFTTIDYYAMGLAQKFNPSVLVSSDSEAFKIAKSALSAAAEANQELHDLLNAQMPADAKDAYTSLSTKTYFPKSKDISNRGIAKEMLASIKKIVGGCKIVREKDRIEFQLNEKRGCRSVAAKALASLGFETISQVAETDADEGQGFSLVLSQSGSRLIDMTAKAEEIAKESSLSEIAPEFEDGFSPVSVVKDYVNGPDHGHMGGGGSETNAILDFVGANTTDTSITFQLKYWKGWGDCTMGCGYVHIWDFKIDVNNAGPAAAKVLSLTDYKGPYSN